jgi:hypothetical protein
MGRRRAHRRKVARRDSKSCRPTEASVSAARRGATESPLCGRARGAVASGGAFECGLRLLCCPCTGALVIGTDDFPLSPARASPVCGSWCALQRQVRSYRGASWRLRTHHRIPRDTASSAASSSARRRGPRQFFGVLYMGIVTRFQHLYYQVTYGDGDTKEHTGREPALKLKVSEVMDRGGSTTTGPASAWRAYPVLWSSWWGTWPSMALSGGVLCPVWH